MSRWAPGLRAKIVLYLVLLHVVLGAIALLVLLEQRAWLIVFELLFLVSAFIGVRLARALFVPLELVRTGAELIAERDFSSRFRPVGQPEMDRLIEIYNTMVDRLHEERVRLQEQHYFIHRVLAASPSGLVTLDHDGRVSTINPSALQLARATEADVLGRTPAEIESAVVRALDGLAPGASTVTTLESGRRVRCTAGEFVDRGFPRRFFVLEEMTEALRASERAAYQQLIRMMSHEINNSVGAVSSLLDSCRTYGAALAAEDRADFENAITVASARLLNLDAFMSGFADVVRLPAPERRPCDLRLLVEDILVLLRPELERRRIVARWERADTLPPLALDKNQVEQALVNVIKNAAEAIGEDGRITLTLERDGAAARLAVRDSGPGLSAAAKGQLFTPFFSTKRNGRGLGLTLVQEILTRHGAEFGLRDADGGGALFWVSFKR